MYVPDPFFQSSSQGMITDLQLAMFANLLGIVLFLLVGGVGGACLGGGGGGSCFGVASSGGFLSDCVFSPQVALYHFISANY